MYALCFVSSDVKLALSCALSILFAIYERLVPCPQRLTSSLREASLFLRSPMLTLLTDNARWNDGMCHRRETGRCGSLP